MVVGVEQGIILAIGLSIVEHIYHSYRPYDTLLAMTPDGTPGPTRSRIVQRRCRASWSTASGRASTTRTARASPRRSWTSSRPPIRRSAGSRCPGPSIGDIDYSGADTIRQVKEELARTGVTFAICDLSPKVRGQLDAYGLTELIGTDRIFATTADLLAAYRASARRRCRPESPPAADPAPAQG